MPPGRSSRAPADAETEPTDASYGTRPNGPGHGIALATVAVLWAGTLLGRSAPWAAADLWRVAQVLGVGCMAWAWRSRRIIAVLVCAGSTGLVVGAGAWWSPSSVAAGECGGRGIVIVEAERSGAGVRAVVEIDGVRLAVRAHGRPAWRIERLRVGESASISGTCRPVAGRFATWQRSRHVLGEMTLVESSESVGVAPPVARSVNRLHDALRRGARSLPADDAALYGGLVVGADAGQPREMVESFRRTGLGHLTAVSGQNVAYVMALVGMAVSARRRTFRVAVMLVMLGWFALLTRAEPSVVRAVAAGAVTVLAAGVRGPMVAAVSIGGALLVDPMLAHSVGFQLSCAAAVGLTLGTGPVTSAFGGGRAARFLAPTVTAQLATIPVSWLYFGVTPAVAIPANLLAAPVAGMVMLCGLPAGLAAALLPDALATAVMLPVAAMVRWVWWIAHVGGSVEVPMWVDPLCWCAVVIGLAAGSRRGITRDTPAP